MPGHLTGTSLICILELKNLPFDSLLGTYPKDSIPYSRDTCSYMLIVAVFSITEKWNLATCPSIDKWTMKNMVHRHNGILFDFKKK